MTKSLLLLPFLSLLACPPPPEDLDKDGDGYEVTEDCDDLDATVHPDADELCNLVDDDCDGDVDEEVADAPTWYTDADGDGYGDEATTACAPADDQVASGGDCDDADPEVHPAATDECTDPRDLDCDGDSLYADADGDGWAECAECDDSNAANHPGAEEVCNGIDDDCNDLVDDEATDASTWYADLDGDGFGASVLTVSACDAPEGYVAEDSDCHDGDASVYPGAAEVCNGVDDDCDGSIDEEAVDLLTWYEDDDGDGWGDEDAGMATCEPDPTWVMAGEDCDDADAGVNPAAQELCNEVDDDCDGTVDSGALDADTWYADDDGDGWGDEDASTDACDQPSGYVAWGGDCDDTDEEVSPAASEWCADLVDNDCDGETDEDDAADARWWYADADGDLYGDAEVAVFGCEASTGYVSNDDDCADDDDTRSPANPEWCGDEIDNDCDGDTDEADSVDAVAWYEDADGDGYGNPDEMAPGCEAPPGYTDDSTDCDDSDAIVNPEGVEEPGNSTDENCDGLDYDGWLVIPRDSTGATELWAVSDDGTTYVQLTDGLSTSSTIMSDVSGDGERIAVAVGSSIYVLDSDGEDMAYVGSTGLSYSSWISWLADDEHILQTGPGTCSEDVIQMNVDTGSKSTFYDRSDIIQRPEANPVDEDQAIISVGDCGGSLIQTVYIYDRGTGGLTALAADVQWWSYAWSSDGDYIAYVTSSSGYQDLVIHDKSSSSVLHTTSGSTTIGLPTWGNDDRYLYVVDLTLDDLLRIDSTTGTSASLGATDLEDYGRFSWTRIDYDIDRDDDGWGNGIDCDPDDASANPDATEICDGIDNDCDGDIDEEGVCCEIQPLTTTEGLWCFLEETGTTSVNHVGSAPDVTGIDPSDWISGGGINPVTSTAQVADDPAFDLGLPWSVEVSAEFDTLTATVSLLDRVAWGTSDDQWVRLMVSSAGAIRCETGENGVSAFNTSSSSGVVTTGTPMVIGCSRSATGDLSVLLDGVDVSATSSGTTSTVLVGDGEPLLIGYTDCPSSTCPGTPYRLDGVIYAVALHGEEL